jgi:hypothetical protein
VPMKRSIAFVRGAWILAALGCSSATTGPTNEGSGAAAFAGTYTATYVGTYAFTSPANEPQTQNTESGTFVISAPTAGTLNVEATFTGAGGVTGVCTGSANVNGDTAASNPVDQGCTYDVTGGTQTNVGSSAFTLSGNTITDLLSGTFTGSSTSGSYGGTFSGTWTLTRQQ